VEDVLFDSAGLVVYIILAIDLVDLRKPLLIRDGLDRCAFRAYRELSAMPERQTVRGDAWELRETLYRFQRA
jgi:hypothetical protein